MNINFDNVKESGYINEVGVFDVTVKSFKEKEVTVKGEDMTVFEVIFEEETGKTIKGSFWTGESDLPKLKAFFTNCGIPVEGTLNVTSLFEASVGKAIKIRTERQKSKPNLLTGDIVESPYVKIVYYDKV